MEENTLLYDWLTVSSKIHGVNDWLNTLGMEVEFTVGTGRNGYRDGLSYDGASVWSNAGRAGMETSTCLNLSGQGCRAFESFGTGDFDSIFDDVLDNSGDMGITRLDVAFDDHSGLLDMQRIAQATRDQNYISRFQYWEVVESSKGCTVQHGSPASDVLIRIYDKALERGFTDGTHWIRCELQLRRQAALGFITDLRRDHLQLGQLYSGVILNYLRFLDPGGGRRYGDETSKWWTDFLRTVERHRIISKPGTEYNIFNLKDYVIGQAGNSIWTYIKIAGVDQFLKDLEVKDKKLNDRQRDLIRTLSKN